MHCIPALCQCGQDEIEVQREKNHRNQQTRRDVIQKEIESEVEIETDSTDKINRTNEWSNEHLREQQQWTKYILLRVDCKIPLNQIAILPFTFAVRDVSVCTLAQAFICFPLQWFGLV